MMMKEALNLRYALSSLRKALVYHPLRIPLETASLPYHKCCSLCKSVLVKIQGCRSSCRLSSITIEHHSQASTVARIRQKTLGRRAPVDSAREQCNQ